MFGLRWRYVEVMRSWIKRHWRWALPVAAAVVAAGAWLVFSFFAFQTYFTDDEVDEALPFFTAGPAPSGMEGDETTQEQADAMNEAMADQEMPEVDEVAEPMPEMSGVESRHSDDTSAEEAQTSGEAQSEIPKPGVPQPEIPKPGVPQPEVAEPEVAENLRSSNLRSPNQRSPSLRSSWRPPDRSCPAHIPPTAAPGCLATAAANGSFALRSSAPTTAPT